jgi:hypothetical protein
MLLLWGRFSPVDLIAGLRWLFATRTGRRNRASSTASPTSVIDGAGQPAA